MSSRSYWASPIYFGSRGPVLHAAFANLLLAYPNWTPRDAKELTPRERKYYLALAEWVIERRQSRAESHG